MRKNHAFIICYLIFISFKADGQKILDGDTIYVNDAVAVTIVFPGEIYGDPQLIDPAAPFKLNKGKNSVTIKATSKDAKNVNAVISEGKRDHSVVLSYKAGLKIDVDDYYDFSTPKMLEDFIKQSREKRKNILESAGNEVASTAGNIVPANNAVINKVTEAEKADVTVLLKEADVYLRLEEWEKAENSYLRVLKIDQWNNIAKKGITDISDIKVQKKRLIINEYKSNGKKEYESQNFSKAIIQYKKVLELDQKDLFASSQINEIQKKIENLEITYKQNQERQLQIEKNNRINNFKSSAAKALSERKYDEAIAGYQAVLTLNDKDDFSTSKIKEIEKIKQQEEANSKANTDFNTYISDGDKASANNEFELAKSLYLIAKKIKPSDLALDKKIVAVNERILFKDIEDKYKTAIAAGDEAKKVGEYERAKTEYGKAVTLFKDRVYPSDQIKEITEILNRDNELKKTNAEYVAAIEKADNALVIKNLNVARTLFKLASSLKSEEEYPKNKLSEIDSVENAFKVNKDYNLAIQKAKAAFERNDYFNARKAYSEAYDLKPTDDEPTFQIELINKKINEKNTNFQYDTAIAKGNMAIGEGNFPLALANYKQALKLKPLEALALNQVKFAQSIITQDSIKQAEIQRKAIARVQEEVRKKRFAEGMEYFVAYDKAAQTADLEKEVYYLKKFLDVFPDESEFNDYQYSKKVSDSKKKIDEIRNYWSRTKKNYQPEVDSFPYLIQEFENKYPNINYDHVRNEQTMVAFDTIRIEDAIRITKEFIAEKPRLSFSDSLNNIKIVSEGIRFAKERAYYKIRIQNNDTTDFLTGTITFIHTKKDGTTSKYYPNYISSYPIVLPGKQFFIVYSTKNIEVDDDESFLIEMNDRFKKMKFLISIPGKTYNEERKLVF